MRTNVRGIALVAGLSFGLGLPVNGQPANNTLRTDLYGDPLPEGALLRLGTVAYRAWPLAGVGFRANGDLVAITQLFELHTWPADGKSKPTIMRLPVDARGGRAAIAPNCRYALTESDRKLIVWDISGDQPKEFLTRDVNTAYKICFSADGSWLAVNDLGGRPVKVLIANLANRTWQQVSVEGDPVRALSFSENGKSLAVTTARTVTVFDTGSAKQRLKVDLGLGGPDWAALSNDGENIAISTIGAAQKVQITSVESQKETAAVSNSIGRNTWMEFSRDGKALLLGNATGVRERDLATDKLVREMPLPADVPFVYSADRRRMATLSGSTVILLDAEKGTPEFPELLERGRSSPVEKIRISPDGKRIATLGGHEFYLWATDTGQPVCKMRAQFEVQSVAFLSDSRSFVTLSDYHKLALYESETGRELRQFSVGPDDSRNNDTIMEIQVSKDGKTLTCATRGFGAPSESIRIDIVSGKITGRSSDTKSRSRFGPDGLEHAHSPDGRWNFDAGKLSRVGAEGSIAVVESKMAGRVREAVFSDDSRFMAVLRIEIANGRPDPDVSTTIVFDLSALVPIAELPTGFAVGIALSPDDRRLAARRAGKITVWDVETGLRVREFAREDGGTRRLGIAFTPDGQRLITGHEDGTALVWDVGRPKEVVSLSAADCAVAWNDLRSPEGAKSVAAVRRLAADAKQAVPFLKEHLAPLAMPSAAEIQSLVQDLNSTDFKTRDAADNKLRAFDDRIAPLLREALKQNPPAETRKRLDALLAGFATLAPARDEILRRIRAIWVLELIGSPEARGMLQILAKGGGSERVAKEAQIALERIP